MLLNTDLMIAWGGTTKKYEKDDVVFYEGDDAEYYYQVLRGSVRMSNMGEHGKEFVQGEFTEGKSFGEPPLFINEPYPATAIASMDSIVMRLPKSNFFTILDEYPSIQHDLLRVFAWRIYNKAIVSRDITIHNPEHRIFSFLRLYKKRHGDGSGIPIPIYHTRQEIANQTGLRVETVIRTLTKMSAKGIVVIRNRKLYF
ncbi:MAG: Crp/Fnr family transcriptional regulator [Candidatus Kapabacteria bacterium]|nr:Crp/Fnr family transcriptional regulator [Candidatus Kapabacteria bacterium]